MAATKKTTGRKSSSGSDPKSKSIVKKKIAEVMQEFKEGELTSGNSTSKVSNPKQAIAIALSEARKAGAKIPEPPSKAASKKSASLRKKS